MQITAFGGCVTLAAAMPRNGICRAPFFNGPRGAARRKEELTMQKSGPKAAKPRRPAAARSMSPRRISASWVEASAEVVGNLENSRLPALLVRAMKTIVDFEYSAVFVYRGKAQPIHLFDTLPRPGASRGLVNYLNSTYVLNPFYRAYLSGIAEGVYRMRDLAPQGFFDAPSVMTGKARAASAEEIGFLTDGWPAGREELCVALRLPGGGCAEISVSRDSRSQGFSAADIGAVVAIVPFLGAALRHHWRHWGGANVAAPRNHAAEDAFQTFGGKRLSPRERQLAQLLLLGHSTASVGLQLGISATTVKSHRKNLYAKLGIGSLYELFSMFREALGGTRRS
jgi:DNA-binding CsgD family transcriptional regulator